MKPVYIVFFIAVLAGTLLISYWAAQRGRTLPQFYRFSGSLGGMQNGLAMAGDFMSAASFLGVTGAIALHGFDGLLYAAGFWSSYALLFAVAEPVRRLGRYTLADVVCARFPSRRMRGLVAVDTVLISTLYLVPQLVAAGWLMHLLLDMPYPVAVAATGILMTMYVIFGGMVSTSWVQIIKAGLLVTGTFLVALMVLSSFHWDFGRLVAAAKEHSPWGSGLFAPGNLLENPLNEVSLFLSLFLGTAGLPHILMRFFTVPNESAVRATLWTATSVIGAFYVLTVVLGLGALALVGEAAIRGLDPTGNFTALAVAQAVGGDFFTAFLSAVAFATILAVVTGLLLAATTAVSHDLYHKLYRGGRSSDREQLRVAKFAALVLGLGAVAISLGMGRVNVATPVSLVFVVAAATNLPLLFFTLFWRRFTERGAMIGVVAGLVASLTLVFFSPAGFLPVTLPFLEKIHLDEPGIVAIPIGFLAAVIGTWVGGDRPDPTRFEVLRGHVRQGETTGTASGGEGSWA
ncbi:solute symporter family protein [Kyrpidia spormannii]|uniref:Acetate transporter n=1 Tax=Kyrpidia spormannii TaxID=2055160 RepID=A0A6F9E5W0_9BACL|nr:cation acetate symporter [Kyrpidia spormannii]CAB3391825.1 acetate transporter [Kyrpidia spormannii]